MRQKRILNPLLFSTAIDPTAPYVLFDTSSAPLASSLCRRHLFHDKGSEGLGSALGGDLRGAILRRRPTMSKKRPPRLPCRLPFPRKVAPPTLGSPPPLRRVVLYQDIDHLGQNVEKKRRPRYSSSLLPRPRRESSNWTWLGYTKIWRTLRSMFLATS